MYLTTAVFPVPVFPKMRTLLGRSPFSAVTRICASCPMWFSRCGSRSGRYDGRRISRSILKIVRVPRYGWKMLSSMIPTLPLKARRFASRVSFSRENRAREGRYQGDPTKRFASFPCHNRCMPMAFFLFSSVYDRTLRDRVETSRSEQHMICESSQRNFNEQCHAADEHYPYPKSTESGDRGETTHVRVWANARHEPHLRPREPRGPGRHPDRPHVESDLRCPRPGGAPGGIPRPVHPLPAAHAALDHPVPRHLASGLVLPRRAPVLAHRGAAGRGRRGRLPHAPGDQPSIRSAGAVRDRGPHELGARPTATPATVLAGVRAVRLRDRLRCHGPGRVPRGLRGTTRPTPASPDRSFARRA